MAISFCAPACTAANIFSARLFFNIPTSLSVFVKCSPINCRRLTAIPSYPLPSVVVVGVLSLAGYLAIALADGDAGDPEVFVFTFALGSTAVMSAWQARNHDRQRCELSRVSRADPLTMCLNRRGLRERADAELAHSLRHGMAFSVLVLDLDNFKQVNDTRGHDAGDQVLSSVATVLKNNLRAEDLAARLGGDEFALLLPEAGDAAAAFVIHKLHRLLTAAMQERNFPVTFSMGLVTYDEVPQNIEEMVQKADDLMYEVKRQGKNAIRHLKSK